MLSNGTSPNSWFLLMARSYRDILPEPLLFNSSDHTNKKNITFRERERYSSGKLVNKECQKIAVTTVVAKK
jgi:hypothetical protein